MAFAHARGIDPDVALSFQIKPDRIFQWDTPIGQIIHRDLESRIAAQGK